MLGLHGYSFRHGLPDMEAADSLKGEGPTIEPFNPKS